MQIVDNYDDPLDKEIEQDPKSFRRNPYVAMITPEEKLKMILTAAFVDSKLSKEDFRKEVEAVLS